jgi:hypothetical protein
MPDILVLLACFSPCREPTPLRPLGRVTAARLSMRGRVPRRGLARWSDQGGSDRTLQRFCTTRWSWGPWPWLLLRPHGWDADEGVVLRGDHGVGTQAGKPTYG